MPPGNWALLSPLLSTFQSFALAACSDLASQSSLKCDFRNSAADGVPNGAPAFCSLSAYRRRRQKRVRELSIDDVKARLDRANKFVLVDVREESEYAKDHLPGAIHLGKGVIERDIEERVPELSTPIVLYCGGGYRSALAADNLQKMGYRNVLSMDGGIRGWREKNFPLNS